MQFCNGETVQYLSNTCGMVKCQGLGTGRQMLSDHTRCQTTLHHSINGLQDCNSYLQTGFSDDTRVSDLTHLCVSWVRCFVQLNKREKSSGSVFFTQFFLGCIQVMCYSAFRTTHNLWITRECEWLRPGTRAFRKIPVLFPNTSGSRWVIVTRTLQALFCTSWKWSNRVTARTCIDHKRNQLTHRLCW